MRTAGLAREMVEFYRNFGVIEIIPKGMIVHDNG
jgi:hypothetical protein